MADPVRARRPSKRVQEIVASAIEREIKDRRLELVTIIDCRVTGDLRDATVFYTAHGCTFDEESDYESTATALEKARGQLCFLTGCGTDVRYTSTLAFEADTVPEIPAHPEELLDKACVRDAELAGQTRNVKPVGDINPYRDEE